MLAVFMIFNLVPECHQAGALEALCSLNCALRRSPQNHIAAVQRHGAEAEGFEPPDPRRSSAFKADAFGRSATLPWGVRVAGQSSGVSPSMAPMRSKTL